MRFLLLGGPLACLAASTWGNCALWTLGRLPLHEAFSSWWTWWAGDVLGVLVFAPLGLILVAEPKDLWRRRRLAVGLPLMISFTLMFLFFLFVRQREWHRLKSSFEGRAHSIAFTLRSGLGSYLNYLDSMAGFFESSQHVGPEQFAQFTSRIFANNPGIQALEWAPRVTPRDRLAFEAASSAALRRPFEIREQDSNGNFLRAQDREAHFPIQYVLPESENRLVVGFDLASEPRRMKALDQALHAHGPHSSLFQGLVQDSAPAESLLVPSPVFRSDGAHQGYVIAVFRVEEMLSHLLQTEAARSEGMRIQLYDKDSGPARSLVTLQAIRGKWLPQADGLRGNEFTFEQPLPFAGRTWQFRATWDPVLAGGTFNWESWAVLGAGVLFTGLLGAMLLIVSGRARLVEGQVEERTAALRQSEAQLLRQSRLLSQTQSAARVGGWEFDLTLGELFWTPETYHLHGLDAATFHPTLDQAVTFLAPAWIPFFTAALARAIHSGEPLDLEVELTPLGGAPIWVQITGRTDFSAGEPSKLYGSYQDITLRKQAEQLKNEFISVVSHELRTPLTALKGALSLLGHAPERMAPNQLAELQRIAQANAERLGKLVDDLLDMEKVRSGKLAFNLVTCSLLPLIQSTLLDNESLGTSRGIRLRLVPTEALPEVLADPQRTTQILSNLLSNAVKFSPSAADITTRVEQADGFLRVSVTDSGPGIPAGFRDRVFEPFTQADGSDRRAIGGTGLGLSICKALIERMGGRIGFESQEGKGSTFWFELPVAS